MCDVGDVGCWGYRMFRICDFRMCDVQVVECSGCGMFGMWDVQYAGCCRCGMLGMWDVRDVVCEMWDADLLNAHLVFVLLYLLSYLILFFL